MTLKERPNIEGMMAMGQIDGKRLLIRRDKSIEKESRSLEIFTLMRSECKQKKECEYLG